MILICAEPTSLRDRIVWCASGDPVLIVSWRDLQTSHAKGRVLIWGAERVHRADMAARLERVRHWTANLPVLVVVPFTEDNARELVTVGVDEVVWDHEMEQRLRSEVLRLLGTRLITRFADGVRRCQRLEADVRHRLAALCETVPIPSDVDVAASFLDTSSSQLRRLLHRAFPLQRGRAVEHLLEWLRVRSACDPARSSKKQRVVAEAMSRTDRALRSTCRRLTGRTMRELRDDPEYLIHLAFDRFGL